MAYFLSSGNIVPAKKMLGLLPNEVSKLTAFIANESGAVRKIREATRIHPDTLREGIERGSFHISVAFKLRDYLKTIPS